MQSDTNKHFSLYTTFDIIELDINRHKQTQDTVILKGGLKVKKEISLEHAADLIEKALTETGKENTVFTVDDLKIIRKAIELAINENEK